MLDLAKLDAEKMDLRIEEISINTILEEIYENLTVLAKPKNIQCDLMDIHSPITIRADKTKLIQILTNLI